MSDTTQAQCTKPCDRALLVHDTHGFTYHRCTCGLNTVPVLFDANAADTQKLEVAYIIEVQDERD